VPCDLEGLLHLEKFSAWQSIVKTSGIILSEGNVPESVLAKVTGLRFEALYRMKMYDELSTEASSLLLSEENRMQAANDDKVNYTVLVSMRLLLNDVKLMTGRSEEAVEQLLSLKDWLASIIKDSPQNATAVFWLWEVKSQIVNAYARLRNWNCAIITLNGMLHELETLRLSTTNTDDNTNLLRAQILVSVQLARLLFQVQDISEFSYPLPPFLPLLICNISFHVLRWDQ
jgi:hypothetical protein